MLKAYFKKKISKKTTYLKPELYPLGRATFLTHGCSTPGHVEKYPAMVVNLTMIVMGSVLNR